MLRFRIALFLVATVAAPVSVPAQRDERGQTRVGSSVETEIRAVHAEMLAAAEKRDAAALFVHILETTTPPVIEQGVVTPTRGEALERTDRGLRGLASVSYAYTRQSITVLGPATVLWVGEGTTSAALTDGRQLAAPFAETIVFVRHGRAWKVLHAHRSAPNPGS